MRLLLRNVEVESRCTDVAVVDGMVAAVGDATSRGRYDDILDGGGGALLPGLHDHHVHLLALAAAMTSVDCGPPVVTDHDSLARALEAADQTLPPEAWIRGTGYHETVAGHLDRHMLDRLVAGRPMRIQHRSGAMWSLNSAALRSIADRLPATDDVERDDHGAPTGRIWRLDHLLRGAEPPPSLSEVGTRLAALGITGVTDATPDLDATSLGLLEQASRSRTLRAEVHVLGADRPADDAPRLRTGPRKIMLHDHDLPAFEQLTEWVAAARAAGRAVAVHAVTRESLLLTMAVLEHFPIVPGNRIEHAAVVPPEVRQNLSRLGVRVVTQPGFIATRGDTYLAEVDHDDLLCLYPYATLVDAGIRVAPSSDAPYGPLDPWQVIAAASRRTTAQGHVLGAYERVSARRALEGYLSVGNDPGGPPRRITPGAPADLCLLHVPLAVALADPRADWVHQTIHADRFLLPQSVAATSTSAAAKQLLV